MFKKMLDRMGPSFRKATIQQTDHKPHWLRYGAGQLTIELQANTRGWLSIDTTEHGPKSAKRTMATLDREEMVALRDFLNEVLGDDENNKVRELLCDIAEHLSGGAALHPGSLIFAEDKPALDVIRAAISKNST